MRVHVLRLYFSILLLLVFSCNSEFEKVIPEPAPDKKVYFQEPKVLYLIVDGARGISVRDAETPNIASLVTNAIYSWNSLSDSAENDATNWADMLTGVGKEKHQVLTEDFSGNKLDEYPVIFKRIKSVKPDFPIATFTSSEGFKENLTAGADKSVLLNNDEEVKNAIIDELDKESVKFVVGHFNGVDQAGALYGYDNSMAEYKNAIQDFDARLGEILSALKKREAYQHEKWLVIVTSNRGGDFSIPDDQNDNTVFSDPTINTFTIISHSSFESTFIAKPYLGNRFKDKGIRFHGLYENAVKAEIPASEAIVFNVGEKQEFTVQLKVKKGKGNYDSYEYRWPSIFGKRDGNLDANQAGWNITFFQYNWGVAIANKQGVQLELQAGAPFEGDKWHDLTIVSLVKADGKRYIRLFTDGVQNPEQDVLLPEGSLDSNDPLTLGFVPGDINGDWGELNIYMSQLKIFFTALPNDVIAQTVCDLSLDESHPYYDYLAGYWPMNEGEGDEFIDHGPFGSSFQILGDYQWDEFDDLICSPPSSNLRELMPKNADFPAQILSWFNIPRQDSWDLDGKVWLQN